MCEGYWETCTCEDCKKVKELFSDLSFIGIMKRKEKRLKEL